MKVVQSYSIMFGIYIRLIFILALILVAVYLAAITAHAFLNHARIKPLFLAV